MFFLKTNRVSLLVLVPDFLTLLGSSVSSEWKIGMGPASTAAHLLVQLKQVGATNFSQRRREKIL